MIDKLFLTPQCLVIPMWSDVKPLSVGMESSCTAFTRRSSVVRFISNLRESGNKEPMHLADIAFFVFGAKVLAEM